MTRWRSRRSGSVTRERAAAAPSAPALRKVRTTRARLVQSAMPFTVARVSSFSTGGRYRVSIEGSLTFRDLGRLDNTCGPPLEFTQVRLDIRLSHVTGIDAPARLFFPQPGHARSGHLIHHVSSTAEMSRSR